jgi:hypothetical protein
LEHTISELQAQIDQLSLALHQWRSTQDHLEPMEQRLSQLTERCAEILNSWIETDRRHARAVSGVEERLTEWNEIEARLQRDGVQRMRELEAAIEKEWKALRLIHEEPVKQLREQATALGETCVSAANLALRSFEKAETRIAALETDLQERLTRLSNDVAALAARSEAPRQLPPAGAAPFPLDGVMRIHDELRGSAPAAAMSAPSAPAIDPAPAPRQLSEPAAELTHRMESLERELTSEREEVRETATRTARLRRDWRLVLAVLVASLVIGGAFAVMLQRRVTAELAAATERATAAEKQAAAATAAAAQQIAATRADAERQISDMRQTALQAQVVSSVLAAPDLVRLGLTGTPEGPAPAASAQVLWSRARGLVVSASRLPVPPAGMTYQVWMVGAATQVSAGLLPADAEGRGSIVAENPQGLPRPVTGVIVTLEPAGGSPAPTGTTVLARVPQ